MRLISFKNSALFKKGIYLSAAAVLACIVAPAAADGDLWRDPVPTVGTLCVLGAFLGYFLVKARLYRLIDEVLDCKEYLEVRKGGAVDVVAFSNIAVVSVSTWSRIHRISLRLHRPNKFGEFIEFLPQASLWSNPAAIERVAQDLESRAAQAKRGFPEQ
jgi:hypothetical protein